jgi:hypothetical protein
MSDQHIVSIELEILISVIMRYSMPPRSSSNLLVHSAGKVFLGQFATRLVVGASVELDALQVSRDNVLTFS